MVVQFDIIVALVAVIAVGAIHIVFDVLAKEAVILVNGVRPFSVLFGAMVEWALDAIMVLGESTWEGFELVDVEMSYFLIVFREVVVEGLVVCVGDYYE